MRIVDQDVEILAINAHRFEPARHATDPENRLLARATRLRLPAASPSAPGAVSASLDALRSAQQELVHAHAEGLPALDDAPTVRVLAGHLVEASRRLTVIDLWIELEAERAG